MIQLSQAAIGEVQRIQAKYPHPDALLRLGIQPGGCADWHYTLMLAEAASSEDQVFTCEGVQIVMDAQSRLLLAGLSLDYSEDLMGGGFRFNNPNAVSSCGCGNSFSVEPEHRT